MSYAIALIRQEFNNFLTDKVAARDRYLTIMRIVARECAGWSEIKNGLEVELGMEISDSRISEYLRQLLDSAG